MISIKGVHIALPVKNLQQTIEFYVKLLGMHILYHTKYYDSDFVMMKLGEHRISFFERPDNVPTPPWVSHSGENPLHIGFVVNTLEEVEQVALKCRELGIEVLAGPKTRRDVNEYAIYCKDPSGYQVEIYCENAL